MAKKNETPRTKPAEIESLIEKIRGTNDGSQLPVQWLPSYFSLVSIRKGDGKVS